MKCYWGANLFDKIDAYKKQFSGSIVRLTDYLASNKKVLVNSFEFIYFLDEVIGNPTSYKDYLANNLNEGANNRIDLEKVVKYQPATQREPKI